MSKPCLYLIPNLLGENASNEASFPNFNKEIIETLNHFAVEHLKDTRRFLVRLGLKHKIDSSIFIEINKNTESQSYLDLIKYLKDGNSVGIISDAGCPGIADPGAKLVALAHQNRIKVAPLIGPSSILLALISSGFNGQSFVFHGYLHREQDKRKAFIAEMEAQMLRTGQTQLFMETPYRNESLFEDLLKVLNNSTLLCIAADLTLPSNSIESRTVSDWKKYNKASLHKRPAIFLIGQ